MLSVPFSWHEPPPSDTVFLGKSSSGHVTDTAAAMTVAFSICLTFQHLRFQWIISLFNKVGVISECEWTTVLHVSPLVPRLHQAVT